jgi:hypothetical protein
MNSFILPLDRGAKYCSMRLFMVDVSGSNLAPSVRHVRVPIALSFVPCQFSLGGRLGCNQKSTNTQYSHSKIVHRIHSNIIISGTSQKHVLLESNESSWFN